MEKADSLVAALGGRENITRVEACITRIRVEVNALDPVSEDELKEAGAHGVVVQQNNVVQIVVGPDAEDVAEHMV
ncbi:PTS sugar transporter [Flaviflexus salsibiostraticola]|uniref:PTS sugar transporter n=1 Tax=Flaviflexus salsibiostraticola TaxID=1282737 RepID=A0A3S8Z8B9_9ACTO|nr:glucose PTS transporter subunit EIIB [Flaviflexus salsibiostraticola]AZN29781.1 PTS sugar transporter [Flaviflexus salsibiostraticola]